MEILSIYTTKKNKKKQHYMYVRTKLFSIILISKYAYSLLRTNLINEGFKITPCENGCEKLEK
jgi:hypothetical protein